MSWRDLLWRPSRVMGWAEAVSGGVGGLRWHSLDLVRDNPPGVLELEGGKVVGDARLITAADDTALADVQVLAGVADPANHWCLTRKRLRWPRRCEGIAVMLAAAAGNNYFHWLVESLPRLCLLERMGWPFASVDYFLINELVRPAHVQSLAMLGIRQDRLRCCHKGEVTVMGKLLLPMMNAVPGQCPPWAIEYLRSHFCPQVRPVNLRLLYVTRRQALRRRILNESVLESALVGEGGQTVCLEELSFVEQISAFASAKIIVAPHGAGLANLIFAAPGTHLIELFAPSYRNPCYQQIAAQLGIDYQGLCGTGTDSTNLARPEEDDFSISVTAIIRILKPWLKGATV